MFEEGEAIAGLERVGEVGVDKRSVIVRFSYPFQEMNLKAGDDLKTQDEGGFGEVWAVDRVANTIDVRGNAETLSRSPGCVARARSTRWSAAFGCSARSGAASA